MLAIDKWIDDPVGALSAHGLAGIWGTLACGLFTAPRLAEKNAVGEAGLFYTRLVPPALRAGAGRRGRVRRSSSSFSFVTFWAIKKTYGLRVTAEEEDAGLDIFEHGMYGYPEQFIPAPELVGYAPAGPAGRSAAAADPAAAARAGDGIMKKIEAYIRHEAFEPIRDGSAAAGVPVAHDHRRSRAPGARRASPSATAARS